ncbi:MAG: ABC transporter substrate-binding protein [Christensenellaceae bacterium]|jgi:branched-chain amino acid transport system substrate-binding protein|nr:ABC transporter substrate-binding protein [Christensenellaceae bacterium]
MKKGRFLALVLTILMLANLLAACSGSASAPTAPASAPAAAPGEAPAAAPSGEAIKIGAVLPLSSSAGVSGARVRKGMEFAANKINAAGGVNGSPIEIIFEDTQSSDPALAMSAVEKLIHQDKVNIIVGCYGSSASLAALPLCEENGVVMLEPIATSPAITSGSEWAFRISSTNGIDAEMVGPYLPALGFEQVAYMPVDNDWGLSVTQNYIPVLEGVGAKTVTTEGIIIGEGNYLTQLTKIKNSGATSVIITQDVESCSTLIRQMVESGMGDFKILSTSGNNASMVRSLIGDAAQGVYFIEYYAEDGMVGGVPNEKNKAFTEEWNAANSDTALDYFVVQGVSAVEIIAQAIAEAGSADRTAIRDALRSLEYEGLRSTIKFDEFGQSHGEVILTQIKEDNSIEIIDYKK